MLTSAKYSSQLVAKFREGTLLHLYQQSLGYRCAVAVIQLAGIMLLQHGVKVNSKVWLLDDNLVGEYL